MCGGAGRFKELCDEGDRLQWEGLIAATSRRAQAAAAMAAAQRCSGRAVHAWWLPGWNGSAAACVGVLLGAWGEVRGQTRLVL